MGKRINHFYEFGDFRLDLVERRLLRNGAPIPLPPKAFETLLALVTNSGHLLTKEELMRTVWRDAFVEENNLTQYISLLRKVFNGDGQQFIETVPRLGYRFTPSVKEIREENEAETTFVAPSPIEEATARSIYDTKEETEIERAVPQKAHAARSFSLFKVSMGRLVLILLTGLIVAFLSLSLASRNSKHQKNEQSASSIQKRESSVKRQAASAEANEAYLKGRYFWDKRTPEGFAKAVPYFQRAIELDPNYAPSYAGLADCYLLMSGAENTAKAKEAVMKALEIDETLAEAHASLGNIYLFHEWNWAPAEKEFRRAIELNPDYATAHHWYAYYLTAMGRMAEAIAEIKRAREAEPLSLIITTDEGQILYFARRYDEAIERYREALQMDSRFVMAHCHLAEAYEQKGMVQEMSAESQACGAATGHLRTSSGLTRENVEEALQTDSATNHYSIALFYTRLGDKDQAFTNLNRAFEQREPELLFLKVDPRLDNLRSDPRFQDLLRRMNLI